MNNPKRTISRGLRFIKKRLTSIKFDGFYYKVNLKDKITITKINIVLFFKRQFYRFKELVYRDNRYIFSIVLVLWAVFIFVSWLWGKNYTELSFTDVLWDVKNEFFTSVIIVIAINMFGRVVNHKEKLCIQHLKYYEIICGIDHGIFWPYIGDEVLYYMPFYCEKCLNDTLEYIESVHCRIGDKFVNRELFYNGIHDVNNWLNEIEQGLSCDMFVGVWNPIFAIELIKDTRKLLDEYGTEEKINLNLLYGLSYNLLKIINYVRLPWRWDINSKIKILRILEKYPESKVNDSFYYSMLLHGHKFNSFAMATT